MSNEVYARRDSAEEIQRHSEIHGYKRSSKVSDVAIVVGEAAWHSLPSNESVLREIGSDQQIGLTTEEATKRLAT